MLRPPEKQPETAARPVTWGPAPDATGWLVPQAFVGSGFQKTHLPCSPSSHPSLGSLPGQVSLLQVWVSAGERGRVVEAPCKQSGQRLNVNQLRHLPATCGSARARSKAERTKTPEPDRQVVQARLLVHLSTCPGPVIRQCGESYRTSLRPDHERWARKTFHGETSHSIFERWQ